LRRPAAKVDIQNEEMFPSIGAAEQLEKDEKVKVDEQRRQPSETPPAPAATQQAPKAWQTKPAWQPQAPGRFLNHFPLIIGLFQKNRQSRKLGSRELRNSVKRDQPLQLSRSNRKLSERFPQIIHSFRAQSLEIEMGNVQSRRRVKKEVIEAQVNTFLQMINTLPRNVQCSWRRDYASR
jgi:hypothetical protein